MTIRKIMVPVDTIKSDNTLRGVKVAIEHAKWGKSNGSPKLFFVHVFPADKRFSTSEKKRLQRLKKDEFEEDFDQIRSLCEENGVENIETIFKRGNPDEEIVRTAQEENVDLIVMGSGKLHDRSTKGKIKKFVYGSVTEKVLHEAPCSILVARS